MALSHHVKVRPKFRTFALWFIFIAALVVLYFIWF